MGNVSTTLTQEQMEQYQDCTYFSKKEIARLHSRFQEMNPHRAPNGVVCNLPDLKIPPQVIAKIPEIKDNPFVDRIIKVFSEDGTGNMSFDDFLDMFNAFSENAPREVKTFYAFRIYDSDDDDNITANDIRDVLDKLTRDSLTPEETQLVIEKVIEESELDGNQEISYMEFEHVVSRSPEFINTFRLRI